MKESTIDDWAEKYDRDARKTHIVNLACAALCNPSLSGSALGAADVAIETLRQIEKMISEEDKRLEERE